MNKFQNTSCIKIKKKAVSQYLLTVIVFKNKLTMN